MRTEKQAKKLWCPYARVSACNEPTQGNHSANRHAGDGVNPSIPYDACCIASQCSQWRWQPLQADQPFMDAVKKRMDDSGAAHTAAVKYVRANLAEYGLPDKPYRGYCGIAGKPEA